MRKFVIFLVMIAGMVVGQQQVFSQATRQEEKQLALLEKEITRLENIINQEEKSFAKNKHEVQFELWKKLRALEIQSDPRRAASVAEIEWLKSEMERIKLQIDSVESIPSSSNSELDYKKKQLVYLQNQRDEMIQNFLSPDLAIPREMGPVTKNRRLRSNVVRREELVLAKIENNIGSSGAAINPVDSPQGYKVIFDNKYSLSTTFVLVPLNGGERVAISLSPKTRQNVFVLPGKYLVEFIVNGRKWEELTSPLTIDGTSHLYEGELCFGFVYKSKF